MWKEWGEGRDGERVYQGAMVEDATRRTEEDIESGRRRSNSELTC